MNSEEKIRMKKIPIRMDKIWLSLIDKIFVQDASSWVEDVLKLTQRISLTSWIIWTWTKMISTMTPIHMILITMTNSL